MRRHITALGALALLGVSAGVVGSSAATGRSLATSPSASLVGMAAADRAAFRRIPLGSVDRPRTLPAALRSTTAVTATVVLAGTAVADAVISERDQGRDMSRAGRAAKRRGVAEAQAPVVARIRATGATVMFVLQDVINAVVVRATPRQLSAISRIAGVNAVERGQRVERDNTAADLFTGAASVWQDLGETGAGQRIAVLDTGIDYTHADFGGSGNPDDFANNDGTTIEPDSFPTSKVVGGYDFVGDAYDAGGDTLESLIPQPDEDPLDCEGHGTHVAGTAAGFGVAADGSTFEGPYTPDAIASLKIGPGTAPHAELLAYRIFGCAGSVDSPIILAALDRALRDGATVANMSLGSPWGTAKDVETAAINRASKAGMLVVVSAGNDGHAPYLVGSPASADRALSVAAFDAKAEYPGATLDLDPSGSVALLNANDSSFDLSAELYVLDDGNGGIGLGCAAEDYPGAVSGKIVVTLRGDCARIDRATLGEAAGAVAVIMVNNGPGYPIFEGPIAGVTIPFLGASADDADTLQGAHGTTVAIASGSTLSNPGYRGAAGFTSGGPRSGDSVLKPEVAAPGVDLFSAAVGSGSDGVYASGTSMAAPHTSGIAALVRSRHPSWGPAEVKAALMNTASADAIEGYSLLLSGSGVVDAVNAVSASVVAVTEDGRNSLSFGFKSSTGGISAERSFTIVNDAPFAVTYDLSAVPNGDPRNATFQIRPSRVSLAPGERAKVSVRVSLNRSAAGALPGVSFGDIGADGLTTVQGVIEAVPVSGDRPVAPGIPAPNPLRVPYLLVPKGDSNVSVGRLRSADDVLGSGRAFVAEVKNNGAHVGSADVYAWQLADRKGDAASGVDVVSVGIQSFALDESSEDERLLVLAVNFAGQRSTAASKEIDVPIDVDGDFEADYYVFGLDRGLVLEGVPDGVFATFIMRVSDLQLVGAWQGDAPMNGSTVLLPFLASEIGLTAESAGMRYAVSSLDLVTGAFDDVAGSAVWDPFDPAVLTGQWETLEPGQSATIAFLDRGSEAVAGAGVRGYLVVTLDDAAGKSQADPVPFR